MTVVIPTGARVIDIDLDTIETNIFKNVPFNTNEMFYSTDIGMAFLKFTGTAQNYTGCTARLTLINFNDGSKVQRTFEMETVTTFVYPMLETELAHAGRWIGQIAIIKNGTTISDNPFRFKIDGPIMTTALISFDNINIFTSQLTTIYDGLNTFLDAVILDESGRSDAEGLRVVAEGLRVTAEQLRVIADALRETKEGLRQSTFVTNEGARQVTFEGSEGTRQTVFEANEITRDGIVNSLVTAQTIAQKVAEKYQLIESTQANRLLTVERQLEQKLDWLSLKAFGAIGDGIANDTIAFINMVSAAGVNGSMVVSEGNYLVDDTITLLSGQTIIFSRNARVIASYYTAELAKPVFLLDTIENVKIVNPDFHGQYTTDYVLAGLSPYNGMNRHEYGAFIVIRGCENITISAPSGDHWISGIAVNTNLSAKRCENIRIINPTFHNLGFSGIIANGVDRMQIENSYFDDIKATQGHAQHGIYFGNSVNHANVIGVVGRNIYDLVNGGHNSASLVQNKGRYNNFSDISCSDSVAIITSSGSYHCNFDNISGFNISGGDLTSGAVYINSGYRNKFSNINVNVVNRQGIVVQSENWTQIENPSIFLESTSATNRAIFILGGSSCEIKNPNIVGDVTKTKSKGVVIDGGQWHKVTNPSMYFATSAVEIISGVKNSVTYSSGMLEAVDIPQIINLGTNTIINEVKRYGIGVLNNTTSYPSISGGYATWKTNNVSVVRSHLNFLDGYEGQVIFIIATDNNTTLVHNINTVLLSGGIDFMMTTNDTITLVNMGSKWYEISRTVI